MKTTYNLVDSRAEGFAFLPEHMVISPLTSKKRWTKREVITIYNSYQENDEGKYSLRGLSNKTFGSVVQTLVDLGHVA